MSANFMFKFSALQQATWKLPQLVRISPFWRVLFRCHKHASNYACFATVLYFYDYLVTIHQEVRTVWNRRVSRATVTFVVARYLTMVNYEIRLIQVFDWHKHIEPQVDYVRSIDYSMD